MYLHESVFVAPQTSQELLAPSSRSTQVRPTCPAHSRSRRRSKRRRAAALRVICLATLPLALACASQVRPPVWENRPQLVEVDSRGPGRLFVKRDHEIGRYDDLFLFNVGFHYRDGQSRLGAADEDRIMAMLVAAIEGGQNGGIGVATHPGPCVLAVDFYVKDLELAHRTSWKGSFSEFKSSLGSATLILELRDSQSNEPLARFIERRNLGGGWWLGQREEQLDRLARVVGLAVNDMGQQLSRITSPTSSEYDVRCEGAMTKVALDEH